MIRAATRADLPDILAFIHALAAFEREPDAVEATVPLLDAALFGDSPAAEALIAEVDGASVGFALFHHNFSTWTARRGIWLDDLWVEPRARGRGVGHALLAAVARIAVERGCARFEWWVLDWNAPAIAVYDRLDARAMTEWTVRRLDGDALARLAATAVR